MARENFSAEFTKLEKERDLIDVNYDAEIAAWKRTAVPVIVAYFFILYLFNLHLVFVAVLAGIVLFGWMGFQWALISQKRKRELLRWKEKKGLLIARQSGIDQTPKTETIPVVKDDK